MHVEDRIRLQHMIEAAETAIEFISNRQRLDLDHDRMLLFALVRAIEIIGEAASKISEETKTAYAEIPWKAIIGMRNRLIHAYFDIDTQIVWETVKREIPALLLKMRALLQQSKN